METLLGISWICAAPVGPGGVVLTHPGLPLLWALPVLAAMLAVFIFAVAARAPRSRPLRSVSLLPVPLIGPLIRFITTNPWPLVVLKAGVAAVFLLVIAAGLWGNPIPERNLATTLTWTFWWTLVVISAFFLGTAWCAVCPWDTLASWLVKRRLWRRASDEASLGLTMPPAVRNVWPALLMFVGLTWLELGVGVTVDPAATAMLALVMVVLAVVFMAVFERKAFCRYVCPVGRTLGFYAQLAPVELRPVEEDVCTRCTILACYHGTGTVEPCPTYLTMGRFAQNTYCVSCGACSVGCPENNVTWHLRSMATEASVNARPHWDEAWFMVGLLALTSLHGITMMPLWEPWMGSLAQAINDRGHLLGSFSIGMGVSLLTVTALYALAVAATRLGRGGIPFRRLFAAFAFSLLPVAFAYHLSHNLGHFARESGGFLSVLTNPFGTGLLPLSGAEIRFHHAHMLIPNTAVWTAQAGLMLWGFWLASRILRHRGRGALAEGGDLVGWRLIPMLVFLALVTVFNMWLLMNPMIMRVQ